VLDLLEHLRHLMLVQHTGDVPETLPVTSEARDRLREQAHQLGTATVVHLIDLLAVAVEDMRRGGDPRLPLELALVKVTRASSDLSREGMAFRLDRLEQGHATPTQVSDTKASDTETKPRSRPEPEPAAPPSIELAQLQEAWKRSVLPAVEQRESGMPAAAMLSEAHPVSLDGDTLTVEFPPAASFHRQRAEEQKNVTLLADALYEITGRRLALVFVEGAAREPKNKEPEHPATEGELLELVKSTLDAREIE
jgi:DNA polymerase III gamma/tau subunit